jgi:hypothetical protein
MCQAAGHSRPALAYNKLTHTLRQHHSRHFAVLPLPDQIGRALDGGELPNDPALLRKDILEPAECLVGRCLWSHVVGHFALAAAKPIEPRSTERRGNRPTTVSFPEGAARPFTRDLLFDYGNAISGRPIPRVHCFCGPA